MEIKLRKEIFPLLENGKKKSTSRLGQREVTVDDEIIFVMTEDETVKYKTVVTGVKYCKFNELTEKEAIKEGYDSLKELKGVLNKIYNPSDEDIFTLIEFK